jgi:hypothetical protein
MREHLSISPAEAADRLAIRELIEAYAHCADRRDAKGQMALFTRDTHFVLYMKPRDPKPTQELHSREALAPVFADLNQYDAPMPICDLLIVTASWRSLRSPRTGDTLPARLFSRCTLPSGRLFPLRFGQHVFTARCGSADLEKWRMYEQA